MTNGDALTDPPETPDPEQDQIPVREQVKNAVDARDAVAVVRMLEPFPEMWEVQSGTGFVQTRQRQAAACPNGVV